MQQALQWYIFHRKVQSNKYLRLFVRPAIGFLNKKTLLYCFVIALQSILFKFYVFWLLKLKLPHRDNKDQTFIYRELEIVLHNKPASVTLLLI